MVVGTESIKLIEAENESALADLLEALNWVTVTNVLREPMVVRSSAVVGFRVVRPTILTT